MARRVQKDVGGDGVGRVLFASQRWNLKLVDESVTNLVEDDEDERAAVRVRRQLQALADRRRVFRVDVLHQLETQHYLPAAVGEAPVVCVGVAAFGDGDGNGARRFEGGGSRLRQAFEKALLLQDGVETLEVGRPLRGIDRDEGLGTGPSRPQCRDKAPDPLLGHCVSVAQMRSRGNQSGPHAVDCEASRKATRMAGRTAAKPRSAG